MGFLTLLPALPPISGLFRSIGRDLGGGIKEELIKTTDYVFDQKVAPLTYIINRMIDERLEQTRGVMKDVVYDISELKDECKSDIEELLTNVESKYKDNLQLTFDNINQTRATTILELRQTIGDIDQSIESRINQLFFTLMTFSKQITEITDKFTPEAIQFKLVEPTLNRIEKLENQLFIDLNNIINKLARLADFSVEDVREKLLKGLEFIDKKSGIGKQGRLPTPVASLTDMELYRYRTWLELEKINNLIDTNDSVDKIVDCYMQLQINAMRMNFRAKALAINELQNICLQDYVKYGISIELWKSYVS